MSHEHVELTCRAVDAFNRRDLAAFLAVNDAGIEFAPVEVAVLGGRPYHGHDGVRRWWQETFEIFPNFRIELDEVRDLDGRTLVNARLRGRGVGSGASIDRAVWAVIEWSDEKAVSWLSFETEAEAREAAATKP